MPKQVQFRRGTSAQRVVFTPVVGEPFFDTDTLSLYMGDGATPGGVLQKATGINNNILGGVGGFANVDNPNTSNITPLDPTQPSEYVKDQADPAVVWKWSVARQNWFELSA